MAWWAARAADARVAGAVASIEWDLASEIDHYEPDRFSTEVLRRIVSDPDVRAVEHLIVASPADRLPPQVALDLARRAGGGVIRPLGIAPRAPAGRGQRLYGRMGA